MNNKIHKEILVIEDRKLNYSNPAHFRSKCYSDNTGDNNRNVGNRLDDKNLWLEDFKSPE